MKKSELEELLRRYQKRLRLQDWDIDLKIRRLSEMEIGLVATIDWEIEHKTATISMLDPRRRKEHYDGASEEHLLVHELLHLHFIPFRPPATDVARKLQMEQAINMITKALLDGDPPRRPQKREKEK